MNGLIDLIHRNYERVLSEIERARIRGQNSAEKINLVVVTKAQPIETIRVAYEAGARLFGENYPEETEAKMKNLNDMPEPKWHMIGHLQSRKAKIVADRFDMLHSLDSLELAIKLNNRLSQAGRTMPVLIEVNVGGEASKFGFQAQQPDKWEEMLDDFHQIISLSNLDVRGLMTMPPIVEEPEQSRPYFQQMKLLQSFLRIHLGEIEWEDLSMGTSMDYMIAVEEGATYVRVGTAILGERPRK